MDPSAYNDDTVDLSNSPTSPELVALARYLSGECSPEEAVHTRAWIDSDPERLQMVEQAREIWREARFSEVNWDTESVWDRMQQRRAASQASPRRNHATTIAQRIYQSAAATIACALIAIGVFFIERSNSDQDSVSSNAAEESGRVFATRRGQQSTVRLPDGAEVTLAADSRLRVSERYGQTNRDVYLEGTAQFSVQHDPKRPFVVHTKFGETRDLATVFVVTAYSSDTVQRVIVTDGRVVSVGRRGAKEHVVLNPGEMSTLSYTGTLQVERNVDTDLYTAWTTGELRFANTPLIDIVAELERWYDVTITIPDSRLAMRPLTVSLGKGTINDAMRVIGQLLGTRTIKQGSTLRIEESAE